MEVKSQEMAACFYNTNVCYDLAFMLLIFSESNMQDFHGQQLMTCTFN